MDFEGYKSAWQKHSAKGHPHSSIGHVSQSLRFLRTSAIRDLQRSHEVSRIIFCLLFATVALGVSIVVTPPGASRLAARLLATALFVDGLTGVALVVRRLRAPSTATMLEFISRELSQVESQIKLERLTQWLMVVLGGFALLIVLFSPMPLNLKENALEALTRTAILTAFLAMAWRRAKSHSREIRHELDHYLKDLRA